MVPRNLVGTFFRVVEADEFRILLEYDNGGGVSTNKFVLIQADSIARADHGILKVSELKKS